MTKKDTIIACFCAAFLMLSLGAIGSRGRNHAKSIICQVNLSKMSMAALMYANDNDGTFYGYTYGLYLNANIPYIGEGSNVNICPETVVPDGGNFSAWGTSRQTWIWNSGVAKPFAGSYALNGWLYEPGSGFMPTYENEHYFGSLNGITSPDTTPIFADAMWVDGWPKSTQNFIDDIPANYDLTKEVRDSGSGSPARNHIRRFVMDRHFGSINVSFADGHAEPVELKELWSLTWHKNWEIQHDMTRTDGSPIYPQQ